MKILTLLILAASLTGCALGGTRAALDRQTAIANGKQQAQKAYSELTTQAETDILETGAALFSGLEAQIDAYLDAQPAIDKGMVSDVIAKRDAEKKRLESELLVRAAGWDNIAQSIGLTWLEFDSIAQMDQIQRDASKQVYQQIFVSLIPKLTADIATAYEKRQADEAAKKAAKDATKKAKATAVIPPTPIIPGGSQ